MFPCIILATLIFKVPREAAPQEPLPQHQDAEIPPNMELEEEVHSSPANLGVINVENNYPAQKIIQLEAADEVVNTWIKDEPSYVLANGAITCLKRHDCHFKPTRLRAKTPQERIWNPAPTPLPTSLSFCKRAMGLGV
ncbi:hypothetical protein AMTR_s00070p00125120 [Amborella trichopoda]|uniref:Uncharacterized protein n=1 Tax=Amborella trichopoda TaxID=13333 RepID=U5DDK3_AMBTC|nr:hypothetical protein AMTR_s00070p00125120 [Amborella trichopoda]